MRERAVQFGDETTLVGVLSEPDPDAGADGPAVILLNAGILHRVGPSRMNVRIARRLAREGFTCLRFDFSGIGDSPPRSDRLPFEESSVEEIREAMNHLQETRGTEGFVLVGLCSGADAAYQGAVADDRVVGMVPIDGHAYRTWRYYLHRFLPRLFRAESWRNLLTGRTYFGPWIRRLLGRDGDDTDDAGGNEEPQIFQRPTPPKEEVEEALRGLVDRDVQMLHLFSAGLAERYNYARQFYDTFRSVDFGDTTRVEYFGNASHTFTDLEQLDALVSTVGTWARETWSPGVAASRDRRGDRAA